MLDPRGPGPDDEAWVRAHLNPGELALWAQMAGPDRRHAVDVARRTLALGPDSDPAVVVPAALLHDVGKLDAGLGVFGRVVATLVGMAAPGRGSAGRGRIARYLSHDRRGASMLEAAGASPLTVAWAREHHRPSAAWTVPYELGCVLKAADDD